MCRLQCVCGPWQGRPWQGQHCVGAKLGLGYMFLELRGWVWECLPFSPHIITVALRGCSWDLDWGFRVQGLGVGGGNVYLGWPRVITAALLGVLAGQDNHFKEGFFCLFQSPYVGEGYLCECDMTHWYECERTHIGMSVTRLMDVQREKYDSWIWALPVWVRHDSLIWVRHDSFIRVWKDPYWYECDTTYGYEKREIWLLIWACHDSLIWVRHDSMPWVWHDSLVWCDMTRAWVWHDLLV